MHQDTAVVFKNKNLSSIAFCPACACVLLKINVIKARRTLCSRSLLNSAHAAPEGSMSHWNRADFWIVEFIKTNVRSMDFLENEEKPWQLQKGTRVNPQEALHTSLE